MAKPLTDVPLKRGRKRNSKKRNALASEKHNAKSGPPAHKDAVKRAAELKLITERQQQAFTLLIEEGLTMEQIGVRLGVSNRTAFMDCVAVKNAMPAVLGHDGVELIKRRHLHLIERVITAHIGKAGQPAHASVILAALKRSAEMIGLDAPRTTGFTTEEVLRLLGTVKAVIFEQIADVATRRVIAEELRRRSGLLPGGVIDAEPVSEAS